MLRRFCLFLILLSLAIPMQSAADTLKLDVTTDQDTYITGGTSVDIHVTVSNPSALWDATGVKLAATGNGLTFSYSPASATILKSGGKEFTITATGFIWVKTTVTITASGPQTADYEIRPDTATVTIKPFEMSLKLLSPESVMKIVVENTTQERNVAFDALVQNTGLQDLEGVSINLSYDETKLNCTVSGSDDIARGKTAKYSVNCKDVNSDEQVLLKIHDAHNAVIETAGVRFKFIRSGEAGELNISAGTAGVENTSNLVQPKWVSPSESWSMFRGSPQRSGYSNGTGDMGRDFLVSWTYNVPSGVFGSPAIADLNKDGKAEIVVPVEKEEGNKQTSLFVLSSDGALIWDFTSESGISSSPTIADLNGDGGMEIVFGTNGGEVYALDGPTGRTLWKFENPASFFRSSPLVYDADGDKSNEVYIGSRDGVYAFDGKSGVQEWMYPTGGEVSSSPTVGELDGDAGLEIAFGSEDGVLYVLNGDGGLSWHLVLGAGVIYSSLAITPDKKLVIGMTDGKLLIIENKKVKASYNTGASIGGSPGFAMIGGKVVIVSGSSAEEDLHGVYMKNPNNKIFGLDTAGKALWELSTDGWSVFSSPALADVDRDGKVEAIVGSREGRLYVIDAETGTLEWSYLGGTGLYASPALADVDADGDLEILVAYRFSNQVTLLDSPDKPDLVVSKINFSNEFPAAGERINISVSVKNQGRLASAESLVKLYWGTSKQELLIGNLTFGALEPGASEAMSIPWVTQSPNETVFIRADADPEGRINESNELNNVLESGLKNDLVLSDYKVPELKTTAKVKLKVSVTVENKGRFPLTGIKVVIIGYNSTTSKEMAKKTVNIGANGKASVDLEFLYGPSEKLALKLIVDSDNAVSEMHEDNNAAELVIKQSAEQDRQDKASGGSGNNQTLVILLLVIVVGIIGKKVSDMRKKDKGFKKEKKGKKAKGPKKESEPEPKQEEPKPAEKGEGAETTEYPTDWGTTTYVVETPEESKKRQW